MLQRRVTPARNYFRRTLQIVALVGTLLVGIIALALIASQTPWFRDWLRGYVERQAKQYVNGTVSIGSLGGNLFYGVQLGDVAVDFNGERVMTLKNVEIKYSVAELVSQGMTVREIRLDEPYVLARRDAGGWNLAKMMKKQAQEADRKGSAQADLASRHPDRQRPRRDRRSRAVLVVSLPVADRRLERQGGLRLRAGALQRDARSSCRSDRQGAGPDDPEPGRAHRHARRRPERREAVSADGAELASRSTAWCATTCRSRRCRSPSRRRSSRCPSSAACCPSSRATTCTRRSTSRPTGSSRACSSRST